MIKLTGIGHTDLSIIKPKISKNSKSVIIYRKWRLGDIIMCEPVNRYLSRNGFNVFMCTMEQYYSVVNSYIENPPITVSYNIGRNGKLKYNTNKYDIEYNLDTVGLLHENHTSKVEAFLAAADIKYNDIDIEYKTPKLEINNNYISWAKIFLKDNKLIDYPLISVVRQSFDDKSPRSIPYHILDELCKCLARDFHVLVIGEKPVKLNISKNIHNFTGCTPDIMSVAGLLLQCKLLITGDTGLMHLAGSLGVPMVSILGPTRPQDISSFYNYNSIIDAGKECSPCFDNGCSSNCLNNIDVNFIYNVAIDRINAPFMNTMIIKYEKM